MIGRPPRLQSIAKYFASWNLEDTSRRAPLALTYDKIWEKAAIVDRSESQADYLQLAVNIFGISGR